MSETAADVIALAIVDAIKGQLKAEPIANDAGLGWHAEGGSIDLNLVAPVVLAALDAAGYAVVPKQPVPTTATVEKMPIRFDPTIPGGFP